MKYITYNEDKRQELIKKRNIDLKKVVIMMQNKEYIDIKNHDKRPNQKILVIIYSWYVCWVPFVEDKEKIFLKTAFPSRKLKKEYQQYL